MSNVKSFGIKRQDNISRKSAGSSSKHLVTRADTLRSIKKELEEGLAASVGSSKSNLKLPTEVRVSELIQEAEPYKMNLKINPQELAGLQEAFMTFAEPSEDTISFRDFMSLVDQTGMK